MRRIALLAVVVASFAAGPAHAAETYLGSIVVASTTVAVTNVTTATPFSIRFAAATGVKVRVQCDLAAYVSWNSTAATSSNGQKFDADQLSPPIALGGASVVSVVGVTSSTTTCKFFASTAT